MIIPKIAKT
ncbi:hypothetical protein F383_15964 [Gossypium arboreum]|uniref:Uncharacterized protein n=1 Tax=Gossypium arboreum TaxID=29729 RepID=A0A0B0NDN7_GOSAR|nr:hypothetical protein F383_15964 [Gossypium arboreum]